MNKEVVMLEFLDGLRGIVGDKWVTTDRNELLDYLVDETAPPVRPKPASNVLLIKPGTPEETSKILQLANSHKIPVFPRGGGTGLVGGSIPTKDGIVLSLERLNKIIEVDKENLMVTLEAGVTLKTLIDVAEMANLMFPPHPGDESAHIGGLIACNAGGSRAIRYGVIRNYVKGIEVVLPTGEIITLGGKLLKDVAGYSLMHLMIGSQGSLGIITKVTIRLYPKYDHTATLIIPFKNRHAALKAVSKVLQDGSAPLAIEYIEKDLMEKSAQQLGKKWPLKNCNVTLILIITGYTKEEVYFEAERIDKIAQNYDASDTLIVENPQKQKDILSIRSNIYLVLKPDIADILDIAVPPATLENLIDKIDEVALEHKLWIPIQGHAGDGNLHPHIMKTDREGRPIKNLEEIKKKIYDIAVTLGGSITAEHGIGKIRISDLSHYLDEKTMEIMKKIKNVFDPNNILNPGTIIPQEP